jgi:hypothetical protein
MQGQGEVTIGRLAPPSSHRNARLMLTVRLDVLTLVPTVYRQCAACETVVGRSGIGEAVRHQSLNEYPSDVLEEYERLSAWVRELAEQYNGSIRIRVIDPQSGLGLWKSLRHRVRTYPTFIIDDRERHIGWDKAALNDIVGRAVAADGNA